MELILQVGAAVLAIFWIGVIAHCSLPFIDLCKTMLESWKVSRDLSTTEKRIIEERMMPILGTFIPLRDLPNGLAVRTPTGDVLSRVNDQVHYCASGILLSPRPWKEMQRFNPLVEVVGINMTGFETAEELTKLSSRD